MDWSGGGGRRSSSGTGNASAGQVLYAKQVKTTVVNANEEKRYSFLNVTMELNSTSSNFGKNLVIRLTDEEDPLFLCHLTLNEEDYQRLRVEQGLLVDFKCFPRKLMDLLELCRQEEEKSEPRFVLHYFSAGIPPHLSVVETNPFKHLTHLSLRFTSASDPEVKLHLADRLKRNGAESDRLKAEGEELRLRLAEANEALRSRSSDVELLKDQLRAQESTLRDRMSRELSGAEGERERAARKAETAEAEVERLKSAWSETEERLRSARHEIRSLEAERERLESALGEAVSANAKMAQRVEEREKEVRHAEEELRNKMVALQTANQNKAKLECDLEEIRAVVFRRENQLKCVSEDLTKGNEIIRKLQNEIKILHNKLKLRTKVVEEQEKALRKKEDRLEFLEKRSKSLEEQMARKEDDVTRLTQSLEEARSRLDQSEKTLQNNENVIKWLNKQLNESEMKTTTRAEVPPPPPLPPSTSGFVTSTPATNSDFRSPRPPIETRTPLDAIVEETPITNKENFSPNAAEAPSNRNTAHYQKHPPMRSVRLPRMSIAPPTSFPPPTRPYATSGGYKTTSAYFPL